MLLALTRTLHLLLILVGLASLWALAPQSDSPATAQLHAGIIVAVLIYGPLLLLLPASLRADGRLLTWLCILLLFYFTGFAIQILDPAPARYWGIAKTTLTVLLFCAALAVIRQRGSRRD